MTGDRYVWLTGTSAFLASWKELLFAIAFGMYEHFMWRRLTVAQP